MRCAECECVVERGARTATCPPTATTCCCTHLPLARDAEETAREPRRSV